MQKTETLEELMWLYDFNEADLLVNAEILGFNTNHEWDAMEATEINKKLASEVLDNPKQVLSRLPIEDLRLLQKLKDAESEIGMRAYPTTQMLSMAALGLALQEEKDDGMEMIFITEDFKQAVRPYVNEVLDDFKVKFRLVVEQILLGALNLYGVLTLSELKRILKDCMELEDDGSGVFYFIYPLSATLQLLAYDGTFFGEEQFFISPFVEDFGYIRKEREKRPEVRTLKPFSSDIIKKAGEMPVPEFPNPINEKLLDTLQKKLGFSEQEAYFWEFKLWRLVQEEDAQPIAIFQMLMDASSATNRLNGISGVNEAVQVVMEYLNHAPRWIFRGRSSVDLRKERPRSEVPPQIVLGPNMQRMGYRQEQMQQMVDNLWHTAKVGRNDPCPCGSGKKYKNCCGKGN